MRLRDEGCCSHATFLEARLHGADISSWSMVQCSACMTPREHTHPTTHRMPSNCSLHGSSRQPPYNLEQMVVLRGNRRQMVQYRRTPLGYQRKQCRKANAKVRSLAIDTPCNTTTATEQRPLRGALRVCLNHSLVS